MTILVFLFYYILFCSVLFCCVCLILFSFFVVSNVLFFCPPPLTNITLQASTNNRGDTGGKPNRTDFKPFLLTTDIVDKKLKSRGENDGGDGGVEVEVEPSRDCLYEFVFSECDATCPTPSVGADDTTSMSYAVEGEQVSCTIYINVPQYISIHAVNFVLDFFL